MLPFHTILHPTDFSSEALGAFRLACVLARDAGAKLVVAHVYEPPTPIYGDVGMVQPDYISDREALQEKLTRLELPAESVVIERRLLDGDPAKEILRLARELSCDLIVMGTHGRRGLGRLLMGSVAETVARHAACPVVTARACVSRLAEDPFASELARA